MFDADRLIYNTGRWKSVRRAVRLRDKACVRCGKADGVLDVDHIVPPDESNPETWFAMDNLRLLCRSCHRKRMSTTGDMSEPAPKPCRFHNPPTPSCPHSRDW